MRQGWMRGTAVLGLVWLAMASSGRGEGWILPETRLGVRTAPILLLTRPDIQEELKLSTEQVHSSRRVIDGLYQQASRLRGRPDGEVLASRREIDMQQRNWLENQLTDPQRARLLQIDLQWEGPSAVVSRSWVSNWIGLSDEQRQAITEAVDRYQQVRTQGAGPADEKALAAQVLSVLNADQRERWRGLLGQPFTIRTAAQSPPEAPETSGTTGPASGPQPGLKPGALAEPAAPGTPAGDLNGHP